MLDSCSTDNLSIENYKIQISRFVFRAYPSYVFRFSFLTTLDIYKDCFKGRLTGCNRKKRFFMHIVTRDNLP